MVCSWRALAQGRTTAPRFDDPTALLLLPPDARREVERWRNAPPPKRGFANVGRMFLETRAQMMVARTVEIDDGVRSRAPSQVVILGAGLDGRAWRMPELAQATVFEVDHPDTQREKQSRIGALTQTARQVRFVPVDFTQDSLEERLTAAGHDPSAPTTWIWEGVVMYLRPAEVEETLAVIARRSAPRSRLIVVYNSWALVMAVLGLWLRWVGEPLRSTYSADQMKALLLRHGFRVQRDEDIATIGGRLSAEVGKTLVKIKYTRIATADRE
jgi:methyltransferase (TIGR00027 family)